MKAKKAKKAFARIVGKNNLGVVATWTKLFSENAKRKLTDDAISKAMHVNFPGRTSKVFDAVSAVRSRYNAGLLTKSEVPKVRSVRYDEKGKEISGRKPKAVKKASKKAGKASSKQ
jgi:hypothetical protein